MIEVEELYKSLSYIPSLPYHHLNPERCFILQRRTIFMFDISAKKLIYLSITLGFFVLLATLGILLFPEAITKWDHRLARKKKDTPWKLQLSLFINHAITPLSVGIFYLLMSGILIWSKELRIFGIGVSSILVASIAFRSVKRITQRPRPEKAKITFKDYSFPSGHTTAGFVFFLSAAIAVSRLLNLEYREVIFVFAIICGGIVACSRRYLHVHRFTDVVIGALLGSGCFLFSYLIFFYFGDAIIRAVEQVFFSL